MTRSRLSSAASVLLLSSGTAWAQLATIHTVETGGVGLHSAVTYGTDGLPLISYYDGTNGDLRVAHCLDVACAASTKQTIDSIGDVGQDTSIAIGADGLGIISYRDVTNAHLKVAHCSDTACSGATVTTVTNVGPAGAGTDIAIVGGIPTIAFRDGTALRVARCVDVACSDATAVSHAGGGNNPTITTGGDGLPLVAHDNGGRILLGHCHDAGCTTASFITLFQAPEPDGAFTVHGYYEPSLATGPDGRGVLAFTHKTITPILQYDDIDLVRCVDAACGSVTSSGSPVTMTPSNADLVVTSNDRPVVAWTGHAPVMNTYLQVAHCGSSTCNGATGETIDGPAAGLHSSVALSPAGLALVAYHDQAAGSLKTAYVEGGPVADLSAVLADAPDPVAPTQTLSYTISAHNGGPNSATGVSGTVALPAGVILLAASTSCQYDAGGHSVTCTGPTILASTQVLLGTIEVMAPPGVTGPLVATGSVSSANVDPVPSNNTASVSTATAPGVRVAAPVVVEGNAGLTEARFDVTLLDNGNGLSFPLVIPYTHGDGTATPGSDYLPVVGALTFTSAGTQTVTVGVVGDGLLEPNETFFMQMSLPGLLLAANPAAIIVDDDVAPPAQAELTHGSSLRADLNGASERIFRIVVPERASYEVVADELSGDLLPLSLQLLDATGEAQQTGTAVGTGTSMSLRWLNTSAVPVVNELVRVRSGGCTTSCGPDDVYRLRAYETTARIPRFNNSASQATILLLQNPSDRLITGRVSFWRADGQLAASSSVFLPARRSSVTNTAALAPGQGGSITVTHDAPYGVLRGKAVSLEPSTGFSFDTPLEYRPR
jgi:uncharacterized repeat protein (TIGR01451 family)